MWGKEKGVAFGRRPGWGSLTPDPNLRSLLNIRSLWISALMLIFVRRTPFPPVH